jgi:flagellar biogenesis protein FliO
MKIKNFIPFLLFFAAAAFADVSGEAAPEPLPSIEAPSFESAFVKMLVSLGGLILLVAGTIWVLRKLSHGRFGKFSNVSSIGVLEKRPLSPKSMLYLVQVGSKRILIAESQLEVRTLATMNDTPEESED